MLDVMNKHQQNKGDSWKTCDVEFLEDKLQEEMAEYTRSNCEDKRELIDIANICMMLFHRKTIPFLDLPPKKKETREELIERLKHSHDGSQIQESSILRLQEGLTKEEARMKELQDENKRLKDGLVALKKICDAKDDVEIEEGSQR